jgi:hypothetical protein
MLPCLYAGNTNLSLDNTLVDDIKSSRMQIASIFLLQDKKLIRVTTNVMKNGKRISPNLYNLQLSLDKKVIVNKPIKEDLIVEGNGI